MSDCRYAIVQDGKIVGVVNWDGKSEHPYGDVDLRGPILNDEMLLEDLLGHQWVLPVAKPSRPMPDLRSSPAYDDTGKLIEAIEANPPMPWFSFKSEAKRILGDDMPEKKPDIIAALKAKRNPA
jgi:hypothetical protein